MLWLRTVPARRLWATFALALTAVIGAVAVASGAGGGPTPPPKPLAQAVRAALTAPEPAGVSADITFTNRLISPGTLQGSDPLLTGATGRLWAAGDRVRLELQSTDGDVQVVSDGRTITVYDGATQTAYRAALPARSERDRERVPTLAAIQKAIDKSASQLRLSGPAPANVAGEPAYTVRAQPRRGGGLLAGAQMAWDAARGVPLRLAVYAQNDLAPVLELAATNVSFGPIPAATFAVRPPQGTKLVDLTPPRRGTERDAPPAAPAFAARAPRTLAGRPRTRSRTVELEGRAARLVTYGTGLSGIAVLESAHKAPAPARRRDGEQPGLTLPTVTVGGVKAQQLTTALGGMLRFTRDGVDYVVAGSVGPDVLRAAASGL